MRIISVVSGGFDPVHSGHISYLKAAKKQGQILVVALNSDKWLENKKGKFFMNFNERKTILENFSFVDSVIDFEDDKHGSASLALEKLKKIYPKDKIIFCNGGDRNKKNFLEQSVEGVEFIFGVGGNEKINSSSWILKKYEENITQRLWGNYSVLFNKHPVRVKSLFINPRSGMSFQKHSGRGELWFVYEGKCKLNYSKKNERDAKEYSLNKFDSFLIKPNEWHQLFNPFDEICEIIEIQFGKKISEDDIERLHYYENK